MNSSLAQTLGRLAFIVIATALTAHSPAFEITNKDGKVYRDVTITKVEPDALAITYSDGVAHISYDKLPADLQRKYFDPAKVAAYRQHVAEATKREAERVAEEQRKTQAAMAANAAATAEREQAEKEAAQQEHDHAVQRAKLDDLRLAAAPVALILLLTIPGLIIYFLPSFVARGRENGGLIFLLNLFTGWSLIGWIAAFIWAATSPRLDRY